MELICPVSIPVTISIPGPEATATLSFSSSTVPTLTSAAIIRPLSSPGVSARQVNSAAVSGSSATSSASQSLSPSPTSTTAPFESANSNSSTPDSNNEPLVEIGPYVCTTTFNISTLTRLLLDYIQKTQNTLDANILYVIINIHASAAYTAPLSPAPSPTTLPQSPNFIGMLFSSNLSAFLYTPSNLQADRSNLNASWYTMPATSLPVDQLLLTQYQRM